MIPKSSDNQIEEEHQEQHKHLFRQQISVEYLYIYIFFCTKKINWSTQETLQALKNEPIGQNLCPCICIESFLLNLFSKNMNNTISFQWIWCSYNAFYFYIIRYM